MRKSTFLPHRAHSALISEDDGTEVKAAYLHVDGEPLLQIKVWVNDRGWTHVVLDENMNLVHMEGPEHDEDEAWAKMQGRLADKGYVELPEAERARDGFPLRWDR